MPPSNLYLVEALLMLTKLLVDNVLIGSLARVKYINKIIHSEIGLNKMIKKSN